MPLSTIMLKDVLHQMDTGDSFSIGFRTFDQRKQRGGEYVSAGKAHIYNHKTHQERLENQRAVRYHKNPNHYENSTRNIVIEEGGAVRKLHIRLIRNFNGKTVL
jgi:hypothetical protein